MEHQPQLGQLNPPDSLEKWERQAGLIPTGLTSSPPPQKQIFNISVEEFKQLVTAQVDITALYLLECVSNNIDILKDLPSSKVRAWYQTLQRRGYINSDGTISETGKQLLNMVACGKNIKQELTKVEKTLDDGFELWWRAFPQNDIFEYKGKKFNGSRSLRNDKNKCRTYFDRIINEGEYSVADMIGALEYEIMMKKEQSLKEGVNKLQYLSASTAYLNQRKFEAFIEISKTAKFSPQSNSSSPSQYSGFDI